MNVSSGWVQVLRIRVKYFIMLLKQGIDVINTDMTIFNEDFIHFNISSHKMV